jgi:hypothetical protein
MTWYLIMVILWPSHVADAPYPLNFLNVQVVELGVYPDRASCEKDGDSDRHVSIDGAIDARIDCVFLED